MKPGDIVMRRPGTLGATGALGRVRRVEEIDGRTMVTVQFERHRECFVADTYIDAKRYEMSGETEMVSGEGDS